MKVYITAEAGYEHFRILGVFDERKKAEQLANEHTQKILEEWEDLWSDKHNYDCREALLKSGPHDKTVVHEYEVQ